MNKCRLVDFYMLLERKSVSAAQNSAGMVDFVELYLL